MLSIKILDLLLVLDLLDSIIYLRLDPAELLLHLVQEAVHLLFGTLHFFQHLHYSIIKLRKILQLFLVRGEYLAENSKFAIFADLQFRFI